MLYQDICHAHPITANPNAKEYCCKLKLPDLAPRWEKAEGDGLTLKHQISVSRVDHHIAITAQVEAGSLSPEKLLALLDNMGDLVSFWRIGTLGERVECYLSLKLPQQKIVTGFDGIVSLVVEAATSGLSSDQVRSAMEIPEREGVFPWPIEIPGGFIGK
jgi:hypothetical protein